MAVAKVSEAVAMEVDYKTKGRLITETQGTRLSH
jgi:hypothetical protein